MSKHVFYDLSYAITMSNMIKEIIQNDAPPNSLMDSTTSPKCENIGRIRS
jgi:hypothetical protein